MEFRIGNMFYKVVYEEKLILNGQQCLGFIDYDSHTIKIDDKVQDSQNFKLTLIHEITHGLLYENGLHDLNTEENVDAISKALYQFCIDYMDIDFAEEEKPETEDKNQVGFIK